MSRERERPVRLRWWPAAAILLLAGAALAWQWTRPVEMEQTRVVATIEIIGVAGVLLVGWWLFFCGLSWRKRLTLGGPAVLAVALAAIFVEVRGVTGDFVPLFGWRFAPGGEPALVLPPSPSGRIVQKALAPLRDFPQFLGRTRDGVVTDVALARDFDARPPRLLWRRALGAAWSGFAVAGAEAITQEQRGESETVVCYDLATGAERWVHAHAARYDDVIAGVGPRATPTIAGERVVALGATGILDALDRSSGALIWERDVLADAGAENNPWGASSSPLAFDGVVVVKPGGSGGSSLAAYDAASGAPLWSGGEASGGYASPLSAELAGVRQLVAFNARSLSGHDPSNGRVLWSTPWPTDQPTVAQPLALGGDAVIASSGYGVGWARYRIERGADGGLAAREVWRNRGLKSKFASFVERDGFVYGLDDGILACLDAATGERRWKGGRYGHGQLLLVGELLLVMSEPGELLLVEATPEEHRELARFPVFDGKTWNPPAFAPPYLLVRTDVEAACLELALDAPGSADAER